MCYDFGLISGPLAGMFAGGGAAAAGSGAAAGGVAAGGAAAGGIAAGGGMGAAAIGSSAGATGAIVGGQLVAGSTFLASAATNLSLASSLVSGVGAVAQGQQQKKAYEANARTQQMQALDAQRRGSIMEGQARQQSKMITGAVNANQGGSGVIAGQDTGLDILAESAEFGARDAAIIHANALRESWGLNTQAGNDRFQGQMAANAGIYRGGATFLSGISDAYAPPPPWWKKWQQFQNQQP